MLPENPLAHHAAVERLAQRKYSRRFSPLESAFRELLLESIEEIVEEIEEEPSLLRESRYLQLWAQGYNVTTIAHELKVTREHCSATIRKRVILMLTAKLSIKVAQEGARGKARN